MHSAQDGRQVRPSSSMTGGRSSTPLAGIDRQLDARVDEIARHLLGEANRALSSRTQLRFGRNGSVAVELVGNKRGQWYDHENKRGGSALDLIMDCTGLSRQEAVAWAGETFGIDRPMQKRIVAGDRTGDRRGSALGGEPDQGADLQPPASVIDATAEYFEDEDSFGGWLDECCARDALAHETTRELYAAWSAWAQRAGLTAGSEPKFRSILKARGFVAKRLPGPNVSGFVGIRLRRRDYSDDPRYGS